MRVRNLNQAVIAMSEAILKDGLRSDSRNGSVAELLGNTLVIERPTERIMTLPHRGNNLAATIAESMWVLAGRNDLEFLSHYLPRAIDFSDDGLTWRAGYGPRVRSFHGVDQLMNCYELLKKDPDTRRAVITIFDPSEDFVESKDIPCNNWLNFQLRGGYLHMMIAVRSNDLIWGFSGINQFEWSLLQELLASWLGVQVGTQTWLQGSLHIYEQHWKRAEQIYTKDSDSDVYSWGLGNQFRASSWPGLLPAAGELDLELQHWFHVEELIRVSTLETRELYSAHIPFSGVFKTYLQYLSYYWFVKANLDNTEALAKASRFTFEDKVLTQAWYLWVEKIYQKVADASLRVFLESRSDALSQTIEDMIQLQIDKGKAYGNSWCKRGELFSILPNIFRKTDRIKQLVLENGEAVVSLDETLLDTYQDTLIYCCMYWCWLENGAENYTNEQCHGKLRDVLINHSRVLSDHLEGTAEVICDTVESLGELVESGSDSIEDRLDLLDVLIHQCMVGIDIQLSSGGSK